MKFGTDDKLPVFSLLTDRFFSFSPTGRHVAPTKVKYVDDRRKGGVWDLRNCNVSAFWQYNRSIRVYLLSDLTTLSGFMTDSSPYWFHCPRPRRSNKRRYLNYSEIDLTIFRSSPRRWSSRLELRCVRPSVPVRPSVRPQKVFPSSI